VALHQRRLEPLDPLARHPEKPDAARAAQIFARGAGQRVTAETPDVERDLPDRLRRVEEEEDAGLARDLADGLGRLQEPAVGGCASSR